MKKINDFKKIVNKSRPSMCYSYEYKEGDIKLSIFTMNGGMTYLSTLQKKRSYGRYFDELKESHSSIKDAINWFNLILEQ